MSSTSGSLLGLTAAAAVNPLWVRMALGIQPKLAISAPDDLREHEADAVADRVMRMTQAAASANSGPVAIQRKRAGCGGDEIQTLQTQRASADTNELAEAALDPVAALRAAGRGGEPLSPDTRAYFEPRFGYDFSGVRVHADGEAADAARAVQARAYTAGRDLVFGAGEYAPATVSGKQLLAHELTHVIQQGSGAQGTPAVQRHTFTPSSNEATVVKASDTTKEVKESVKTYCYEILRGAGLDPDAWYSSFTNASFLGIGVADIHTELATHLKAKETFFLEKYGGTNKDAETARLTLGLIDRTWAGGRDYPSSAPISMHLFGLAIDVKYVENPFIGTSANKVLARAGKMFDGKPRAYNDGMTFEQLDAVNDVLVDYFHYLDWNDLRGRLAQLGNDAPPEFRGRSEDEVKLLIQKDIDDLAIKWQRSSNKDSIRKFGFMRLSKEFKDGIGLAWGGSYGDMMHFDMRNVGGAGMHGAAIQGAIGSYLAKKKGEAKKVEADDGHGGKATQ